MKGMGTSHGAATIVNAIANGKGAAFGLDLKTEATVELTEGEGINVTMDGLVGESTALVERCVLGVLERVGSGKRYHAEVRTSSQIPVSRGLKSSSAAANAVVLATLDALNVEMDLVDAVRIGTRAAIDAGVSVTGAFDDACACALGGVVLTDNRSEEILFHGPMPDYFRALIYVPPFQVRKASLPRKRMAAVKGLVDLAFEVAQEGDYFRALTLNGMHPGHHLHSGIEGVGGAVHPQDVRPLPHHPFHQLLDGQVVAEGVYHHDLVPPRLLDAAGEVEEPQRRPLLGGPPRRGSEHELHS